MIQGSDDWFRARLGKVTASRISDVIAKARSGPGWGVSRENYAAQLVAERLTGTVAESYKSDAMRNGTATEPEARLAYADSVIETVTEIGFVEHPTIPMTGASPDGLVGGDGEVQIKCPEVKTHIEALLGAKVPNNHVCQMQWGLACSGRAWCDYVSFYPHLPGEMRMLVTRVHRDDKKIAELEKNVIDFLGEIDYKVTELKRRYLTQELAA